MELFVGFKRGSASNPSADTDNSEPFEKRFDTTYGQMALYSTRMQMYQFRTCVFSVGIFGKIARLFRWDRAGAIVSEPIKYSAVGNRELTEFFYRFDLMSRTQRGWDQTVHDANAEETAAFTQAIQAIAGGGNAVLLKSLLESVGEPDDYPRKKVNITYGAGQRKSYIVGHSLMVPESPTGRATRGFVAMDAKTRKLVFLKDTWRPNVDGVKSEDRWYKRVKGGRNIAPLLHGSDVGYAKKRGKVRLQRTITQNYPKRFCSIQKITGYIHYRTVQPELYVPLEMFKDSKNLTQVMYDAILGKCLLPVTRCPIAHSSLAIQDLYNRGILHKDISTANIMITMDGRGRLIDFDLAGEVGYSGAGRIVRTTSSSSRKGPEWCTDLFLIVIGHIAIYLDPITRHGRESSRAERRSRVSLLCPALRGPPFCGAQQPQRYLPARYFRPGRWEPLGWVGVSLLLPQVHPHEQTAQVHQQAIYNPHPGALPAF